MRGLGSHLSGHIRRWRTPQLLAVGALAILAIFSALALPSALLVGGWATLPADLLVGVSAPAPRPAGPAPRLAPVAEAPATASATPTSGRDPASPGVNRADCATTADDLTGARHLLALLNDHRAAAGVPPLTLDPALTAEAHAHSCDMQTHHRLSHTGGDGSSPFQRIAAAGVAYRSAGENIGETTGYPLLDGLAREDSDMMAEPLTPGDHRWNIMNPAYTRVGLGVVYMRGQLYFTEDFVG